jgi:hypothetical protein
MLTIRKKNIAGLSEAMHKRRIPRIAEYIKARFPHVFKADDDEKVRAIVERADASAAMYGVTDEDDVALFADLCVMYGHDFHTEPWANKVLRSDALTAMDKMLELRDRVFRSGALM